MPESSSETASGTEAAREIVACAERTLAAPSARVELHLELKFPQDAWTPLRGWRGRVLRLAVKAANLLVKLWWKHSTRRREAARGLAAGQLVGEGIAEPARGRYMIDYGSYAELHAEGETFSGRSGLPLQRLHSRRESGRVGDVLWLLRLPAGATDASVEGNDTLHGAVCRRLAAKADMARASAASEQGLAPPPVDRFEDLRALPVTVWIDGQHVRRVRFEQTGPASASMTLDLWAFGAPAGELDWSRLPTFRSPGYEQERQPWYQRVLRRVTAPARGK
jgi:hypothetical protein